MKLIGRLILDTRQVYSEPYPFLTFVLAYVISIISLLLILPTATSPAPSSPFDSPAGQTKTDLSASTSRKPADIAAPENHAREQVYEKVDIFAFGVVLLELLSARENIEVKDYVGFLGGEGACFKGLKSFMDSNMKDYHLAAALCLAVLAKACVADDPLHRPTMDDIMKVLAKMVSPQQPEK